MDISNISQINWDKYLFPQDTGFYLFLKIFCILFDFSVVAFIIYVGTTKHYFQKLFIWDWVEFINYRSYYAKRVNRRWNKIIRRVKTKLETEFKLAVIEADILVSDSLYQAGHDGKTLRERLEKVYPGRISNVDDLLWADKFYQTLVNDPGIKLDYEQTKKIINIFKRSLLDLEAI